MPASLFLVATPIGNLDDITFRAVRTLKEVAVVACEDTRQTRKLLDHFEIATPTVSYHEHNEAARAAELIARLLAGDAVALVSDAGTPLVSDPGFRLVAAAIHNNIPVVPIPGPSALVTAMMASGFAASSFRFAGFLPPKSTQRRAQIELWENEPNLVVMYEAPHRILETLAEIEEICGPDRPVVVARELTKVHEEFLRGPVSQVRAELARRPGVKGEITLLLGPVDKRTAPESVSPGDLTAEVEALEKAGITRMEAMKQVAKRHGLGKREVYAAISGLSGRTRNAPGSRPR